MFQFFFGEKFLKDGWEGNTWLSKLCFAAVILHQVKNKFLHPNIKTTQPSEYYRRMTSFKKVEKYVFIKARGWNLKYQLYYKNTE